MSHSRDDSRKTKRLVRQPLNCQPCRQSKLRCDREHPCSTCRRRKCSELCTYNRKPRALVENDSALIDTDLVARVQELESIIRRNHLIGNLNDFPELDSHRYTDSPPAGFALSPGKRAVNSLHDNIKSSSIGQEQSHGISTDSVDILSGGESDVDGIRYHCGQSRWDCVLTGIPMQIEPEKTAGSSAFGSDFPFSVSSERIAHDRAHGKLRELLSLLPSKKRCDYLLTRYFTLFSPVFHVLHEPSFHMKYRDFVRNPYSVTASWLGLLFVLLALSVTVLEDDDPMLEDDWQPNDGHKIGRIASRFREAAMKCFCVDNFLVCHRLSTLQALILFIYACNQSRDDSLAWTLLGLATNIAVALGCHKDGNLLNLDCLETEVRKRCWASVVMLQTTHAISFGRPDLLSMTQFNVLLPSDVNDIDILPHHIQAPSSNPTDMTYMLFKYQIYSITARICRKLPMKPSSEAAAAFDQEIVAEQQKWDVAYLQHKTSSSLSSNHRALWNILHGCASQLYLLLHRPSMLTTGEHSHSPSSIEKCRSSAETLVDIHKRFYEDPHLKPYKWYTNGLGSFHALHGAVILAKVLIDGDCSAYDSYRLQTCLSELIRRFESLSARSTTCAKSLSLLRHLWSMLQLKNTPQSTGVRVSEEVGWTEDEFNDFFTNQIQSDQWINPVSMDWSQFDVLFDQANNTRVE